MLKDAQQKRRRALKANRLAFVQLEAVGLVLDVIPTTNAKDAIAQAGDSHLEGVNICLDRFRGCAPCHSGVSSLAHEGEQHC